MITDRAWAGLSDAEQLVMHLLSQGVTFVHLPGGVLRVTMPITDSLEIASAVEDVAALNTEILAMITEVAP